MTFKDAKVGDKVWDFRFGWGKVTIIVPFGPFPIRVEFTNSYSRYTFEGKYYLDDTQPSLFWDELKFDVPEKPKQKVKKMVEAWCNVYLEGRITYYTEKDADTSAIPNRIACVKLTGEYEIEE